MMDENIARLRTHRNNVARYRRLLQTKLTDLEREFIQTLCPKSNRITSVWRQARSHDIQDSEGS